MPQCAFLWLRHPAIVGKSRACYIYARFHGSTVLCRGSIYPNSGKWWRGRSRRSHGTLLWCDATHRSRSKSNSSSASFQYRGERCVPRGDSVFVVVVVAAGTRAGRVAVGRYRPTAPTDPDVRTLAHPVPRPTGSPSAMVPVAIQSSYVDMLIEPRCVRHVALDQVCRPTLRFPPQGPPGRVPLLHQYYQSATTPCCHPAALRFLRLAVPRLHSLFRSQADE